MKPFSSLFARILFWFFLNLMLVTGLLLGFYLFQSKMDLYAIFGFRTMDRMHIAGRLISHDLSHVPRPQWSDVLTRYSDIHRVHFALLLEDGSVFFSEGMQVPTTVMKKLRGTFPPGRPPEPLRFPPQGDNPQGVSRGEGPGRDGSDRIERMGGPEGPEKPHGGRPRIMMRTKNPTRYWARILVPLPNRPMRPPAFAMLVAESESITGNGFFFDPLPWLVVAGGVVLISFLLWIPLVRNITRPLARMTAATEEIARGRFDVRIKESRVDEIGRLATSINRMTLRLQGFVKGQKRFLGDVAHELASPVARIQVALSILEQRVRKNEEDLLADVQEDIEDISNLINEILSFSRAEINPGKIELVATELFPVISRVIQREGKAAVQIMSEVEPGTTVVADSELLTRALANIVRNAVRYAGEYGPIYVTARNERDMVSIEVRDSGPGVPGELLGQLFEPFFRPEPSRSRDSGGVGLGLAIVKTCIEVCNGSVEARNLDPTGFAVKITLGTERK